MDSVVDRLRLTGWLGVCGVVVYVATTAAGSLLDPTYSQIARHVSDLTASGASTWAPLAPAYALYNVLCLGFSFALYTTSTRGRLAKAGLILLVLNAFAGLMMITWFREDLGGAPVTFSGSGHIAFASVSSLAIVASSIVFGFAFRRSRTWRPLALFSFATGAAMIAFSPVAVMAINGPWAGLAERAAIGVFLVWLLVVGTYALIKSSSHELGAGRSRLVA